MEDLWAELKSVKADLKGVEQQLADLTSIQKRLVKRQKELEAVLENNAAKERQKADTQWQKTDFTWSKQLNEKLCSVFNMKELRPMQLQTMNATMSGRDCLLIMPTGGGKSLCFQLPALLSKGITLVVSPLVSLMEDQVMALEQFGIEAVMLNADASKETVKRAQADMVDHSATLRLIYVTPEKLAKSKRFMNQLEKMYSAGRFARLVIDEVHCCSQWGHDFRPDYKFLGIMKRQFPKVPLLGLTATATSKVLDDVKLILNIPDCLLLRSSFNRPNLYYQVRPKPSSQEEVIQDMSDLINRRFPQQSGIVYCFSQKESEEVARGLQGKGIQSLCYHANIPAKERSRVHQLWASDQIQVVVATVAFGMGIDKPDVRFVLHHSLSKSMENLYQESGRAGRDGEKSHCILYYRLADVARQSTMVFTERTGLENLYGIVAYCIDVAGCRRSRIAQHFGEVWDATHCAGMCDHCDPKVARVSKKRDVTRLCQDIIKILNHAAATNQRVTAPKVLDAWYGKGTPSLRLKEVKVPGIARDKAERILVHLLLEGYIREDFHFTAYSTICYLVEGARADMLLSGSMQIAMEFESKELAAATAKPSSSSTSTDRQTPRPSGDTGGKVRPVFVNKEHSHFSSFTGRPSLECGKSASNAGTGANDGHKSNSKVVVKNKTSVGKKRKPVISDEDDDTDDEKRQKQVKDDMMDLEGLAFDDDSDFDEPKKKHSKSSVDSKKARQTGKRKLPTPKHLNTSSSLSHNDNGLDSVHELNPICVSDSDD